MNDHSPRRPWNVLFLCTGNSARSIIAESLLRHWGGGDFAAFSAGSAPTGAVQPLALEVLTRAGLPTADLRSKSMDEFTGPDAPAIDFVITVCDGAAEHCPVFPGRPATAHWGVPDPAAVEGDRDHRLQAYIRTRTEFERRIRLLVNLPFERLDGLARQAQLRELGQEKTSA